MPLTSRLTTVVLLRIADFSSANSLAAVSCLVPSSIVFRRAGFQRSVSGHNFRMYYVIISLRGHIHDFSEFASLIYLIHGLNFIPNCVEMLQ